MDPDRWKRINTIFHDALDLAPGDRKGFVAAATLGDEQLQSEVEALLSADEGAGSYLESPLLAQSSVANDAAMLQAGTLLCGRFRVICKIAEGGMGHVYEALDTELGSQVALKVIRPEIASDPTVLARFRQEVKLARRITHPNVCRTYDFERDVIADETYNTQRDIYFLTMEFLPGETLASRIRRTGALSADTALMIARQVADAIDSAHSLGIIHRDLKPGNLMITSSSSAESNDEPRAVITDFGLARVAPLGPDDDTPSISRFQRWPIGTMAYMSPEQLEGGKVSSATDVYSFGLILFEMIAGKRPFPSGSFLEGITQRLAGIAPKELLDLPEPWRGAINWCLRANPGDRPTSAAEVIEILNGTRDAPIHLPRFASVRSKRVWWLAIPLALLLLALLVPFRLRRLIQVSSYTQLTHDGKLKNLIGTDGKWLFLRGGPTYLAKVPVGGGDLTPIPSKFPSSTIAYYDISPDGSKALALTKGPENESLASMWSIPIGDGLPIRLAISGYLFGAFTSDGKGVLYLDETGDLYRIEVDGTARRKLASLGPATSDLRMSPDGKVIRVFRDGIPWELSADGGGLHKLLPNWRAPAQFCCGRWSSDGGLYYLMQVNQKESNQLWVLDERQSLFHRRWDEPMQLTRGPIDWDWPIVGNDPRQIYSGGISYRGELSRIDATTGKMEPFMGGIPAGQIAFSADGKLVIFTGFQERTLWKSNRDGSNRIQLTDGDFSFVESPRFSPDGKQILFANALPNGTFKTDAPVKAYILPVDGGRPQRLLPDDQEDQSDPNWSPDGRQIVLAGGDRSRNKSFIRILDLATRRLKMLPGSSGFSSPRWSPDGRYIAALSGEKPFVRIFDLKEERWSTISAEGNIRYPVFSANGRYLYYLSYRSTPLNLQIYRARVVEGKPKRIVDLAGWPLVTVWGLTMSLDTSDNPIVTRDTGTCDIYSLQLDIK